MALKRLVAENFAFRKLKHRTHHWYRNRKRV